MTLLLHLISNKTYLLQHITPSSSNCENTYPFILDNIKEVSFFPNQGYIGFKKINVDMIDDYVLDLLSGKNIFELWYSYSSNTKIDVVDDIHTQEFLKTINIFGIQTQVEI